jgi:hypothetical protein
MEENRDACDAANRWAVAAVSQQLRDSAALQLFDCPALRLRKSVA